MESETLRHPLRMVFCMESECHLDSEWNAAMPHALPAPSVYPMEREELHEWRDAVVAAPDHELDWQLRELEARRRAMAAQEAVLLAEAERRKLFRNDSHASIWGMLRADLEWSDAECRSRMRVARLCDRFPEALDTLATGAASVANVAEIARGFANPRCGEQIEEVLGQLLNDAARLEHFEMRERVRRWEILADTDGAHRQAGIDHESRNAHVTEFAGIVSVAAHLAGVDGAELKEIFERFADAEFDTDWEEAKARFGDEVSRSLLARTDAQRRADALLTIFRTAAGAAPGTKWLKPVVNVLVDQRTFEDHLALLGLFPARYVDPWEHALPLLRERRCETDTGVALTPAEVFQAALAGYIRFQIVNAAGQVTHQTSKQRLFAGPVREAVMQLAARCTHPGCRVRRKLQADHLVPHSRGGPTATTNGGPGCGRHNRDRYTRGYTVRRDRIGWHTYRPDGTEIGPDVPRLE